MKKIGIFVFLCLLLIIKGGMIGPKNDQDFINSSIKIQEFIEKEAARKDIETVKKEAQRLGKKEGLIIAFVEGYNAIKVNMNVDLSNKHLTIHSFDIGGGN
ncbi:MAG: hypothetical protein M0Q88_02795 [Bacilli bacterium]|nr:hypothetical protein [Bacilli bacterium]